jgi:membrane-bound metal-dependent hydrolase YbcI (DUF457 family)
MQYVGNRSIDHKFPNVTVKDKQGICEYMKGFTHFVTGIAVSSFFPWTIQAAQEGNPFYFLLGGTMALLPDTIDFRIIRYFYRHDIEISPDPIEPDLQTMANAIAQAIDQGAQKTVRLKLNTIRVDIDRWQKYRVRICPAQREVTVLTDRIIDTGGNPVACERDNKIAKTATAHFQATVSLGYLADFPVEMFDGPHLQMRPDQSGNVAIDFIPWHRKYTHSICVSFLLACLLTMLGQWKAACVFFTAHASHTLLDQIGYMGSNVTWPIRNRRHPGLKLQHAASAFWNMAVVWIAIALTYGNLHSHVVEAPCIPPLGFLLLLIAAPLYLLHGWLKNRIGFTPNVSARNTRTD